MRRYRPDRACATGPAWQPAALPIAVGALVLGLLFNQEVAVAVQTWIDSTAYNHCFLVIPIVAVPAVGASRRAGQHCAPSRCRRRCCWACRWRWSGWWRSGWASWRDANSSR